MTRRNDSVEVTVVLWHGQYRADATEHLEIAQTFERALFGLRNIRMVGDAGAWMVIAEASSAAVPLVAS